MTLKLRIYLNFTIAILFLITGIRCISHELYYTGICYSLISILCFITVPLLLKQEKNKYNQDK